MLKSLIKYLLVYIPICLVVSCSTKKNKFVNRQYHNLTSHYNGQYWAEESIKDGVFKIEQSHKDNYNRLLPIFIHPNEEESKSIYSEMDRAIKKSSTVIQRHAITDKKGKEIPGAVRWIDENYMVIGKAYFYKRDFFSAIEVFDYVSKVYVKSPTRYQAMLWLIRTYNEMASVSMSQQVIDYINADKNFPKKWQGEFSALTADYMIKRGMYADAAQQLTKAIILSHGKKTKSRYAFVLAQLYEKLEDNKKAAQYYDYVIKQNPPYDMLFAAKIHRAKLYDADSKDGKHIKNVLSKMAKDPKNKEYLDQIYYAMAGIEEKENNLPGAIDYLQKSVRVSVSNNNQKAFSFLKLADIHFEKPDYAKADKYYDSTVVFLEKDYPNYDFIVSKKKSLNSLIANLQTILLEDSLQKLAKMSELDRNAVIAKIIAKVQEDEKKRQEEQEKMASELSNQLLNLNSNATNTSTNPTLGGNGMWYFYNPITVNLGLGEFSKKWGNRKLEDNWRRSNKESSDFGGDQASGNSSENATAPTANVVSTKKELKSKEYYLKDIPLTAEKMDASNKKIVEAFNNAGAIYKEELLNNKKSIEMFEELIKRYPKNKYELSSYYQLYRLNLAVNNSDRANYYKNLILTNYSDSEYARIIKNPDYAKTANANKNIIERYYSETFDMYNSGNYAAVISRCDYADTAYFKNALMPKFDLLKAMAIGRTKDLKSFEMALTAVIVRNPKELEVKAKAQELLDYISQKRATASGDTLNKPIKLDSTLNVNAAYVLEESASHYWVLVVKNNKGNVANFKVALSNFNATNYSLDNLQITSTFLDNDNQLVYVKQFADKDKALDYYSFTQNEAELFVDLEENTFSSFIISTNNFQALFKNKKLDDYLTFFSENY
ncbi:MAG: hypothetical protein J0M08_02790 [Bacteroidetes bacterium]|nr:hypothetical protein [Bacteroidota bacterium]